MQILKQTINARLNTLDINVTKIFSYDMTKSWSYRKANLIPVKAEGRHLLIPDIESEQIPNQISGATVPGEKSCKKPKYIQTWLCNFTTKWSKTRWMVLYHPNKCEISCPRIQEVYKRLTSRKPAVNTAEAGGGIIIDQTLQTSKSRPLDHY